VTDGVFVSATPDRFRRGADGKRLTSFAPQIGHLSLRGGFDVGGNVFFVHGVMDR
jgi:hypothetical protein